MSDLIREEYIRLGRHIQGQFTLIIQIFTASIAVSLGAIGFIFSIIYGIQPNGGSQIFIEPFLAFAPLTIVFSCGILIGYLRTEIFKWSSYIKVYLNDGNDWRYETELEKYRIRFPEEESFDAIGILYCFVLVLCFASYYFGLIKTSMNLICWLPLFIFPAGLFAYGWAWYYAIPKKTSLKFEKQWSQIKRADKSMEQAEYDDRNMIYNIKGIAPKLLLAGLSIAGAILLLKKILNR